VEDKVVIHLGLHKTGTSFLQRKIFPKIENVVIYRPTRAFEILSIRPVKGKITIISHETLSGKPGSIVPQKSYSGKFELKGRPDFRYDIADSLKKLFPDAKIIIGTRQVEPWVKSLYKQSVLGGNPLKLNEWKEKANKEYWKIDEYVTYLKKNFKDVYEFKFEDFVKNKKDVIEEMCDFIGVDVPDYEDKIVNISLNDKQIRGIRNINVLFKNRTRLRKFITSIVIKMKK
jgi:hypothetical protein